MILVLTALVAAQLRVIDNTREPWATVMTRMQQNDASGARSVLEAYARGREGSPWERAHAWTQAGDFARRAHDTAGARRDYLAAEQTDPEGFDGRMAVLHQGELAMDARRWVEAERTLARVEHDADPIVRAYATARLQGVRERARRLALRYGAAAWLCAGALGLTLRTVHALRVRGWRRIVRALGSALLVTEAAAIAGDVAVRRWYTFFAAAGWMAFAIPAGVVVALMWATRGVPAGRPWWRTALALGALGVALAAGLYLALEITWWSVEHPVVWAPAGRPRALPSPLRSRLPRGAPPPSRETPSRETPS